MEMYAPYSNFSFYTPKDVLRMIDYNTYPSFVLSQDPAYNLALTNANRYYSTEYTEYKSLIVSIYKDVDRSLSEVIGAKWIDRQVLENGVILNVYDNGKKILINYTESAATINGKIFQAMSATVIRE